MADTLHSVKTIKIFKDIIVWCQESYTANVAKSSSVPSPSKVKTAPTKRKRSASPNKASEKSKEEDVKDDPNYVPNTDPSDNGTIKVYI